MFRSLIQTFSARFLLFLVVTQFLLKGICFRLLTASTLPLFKHLGLDAAGIQIYGSIIMSPWSFKPLVGVLSDVVALGGYHKRYWMLASVVVGGLVGSILLLMVETHSVPMLVAGYTLVHFQIAVCDLLSEGKYAEMMRENPQSGSDMVTAVSAMQMAGGILAMLLVGPLGDINVYLPIFIIVMAFCLSIIPPLLLGWMPEEKTVYLVNSRHVRRHWKQYGVAALTGLMGPTLSVITLLSSNRVVSLGCAIAFLAISVGGGYATFIPLIARVATYQVLIGVMQPSLGSALDFFYTADEECLPGGPHFSYLYYVTITGILGSIMAFLATALYKLVFSTWRFRRVLIVTDLLVCLAGVFDLIIVMRWNLLLGIPDHYFYFFGEAIVESMVGMLFWIPSSTILSKVVPPHMESATYSYMAGMSNFARTAAELSGAIIYTWAGVSTTPSPHCSFDSLGVLVFVCHITLPLVIGIPAAWLIPDRKQTEDLNIVYHTDVEMVPLEETLDTDTNMLAPPPME